MRKFSFFVFALIIWVTQSGFTVVGHRGNPVKVAEETIASFDSAFSDGADYVELDLHVSKDNQLVISHDRDLQRITGTSAIVSQNNFAYLSTLHQANGEPMHTLNQIFAYYAERPETKFLIETKKTKYNNPKNMEQLLVETIEQYHMADRVLVHSFSYKSLKSLSKLMPGLPLIFIVGSLKRINFDVLSYVDGINISSKLVNSKLISQLHSLNKKVFVWDEMQENPAQWNWLVNLPIDGVVTNYPSTGFQYKLAKDGTKEYRVDRDAVVVSKAPLTTRVNPYVDLGTNKTVPPFRKVHVDSAVIVNHRTFYQLENGEFIPADTVNFNLDERNYLPYINQKIILKAGGANSLYDNPLTPTKVVGKLTANTPLSIVGMNTSGGETWFETTHGWIQGKNVLIYGIFPDEHADLSTQIFFAQKPAKRLSNISLQQAIVAPLNQLNQKFIKYFAISNLAFSSINDRIKLSKF
ncbi:MULTISPECIES: glycerophosphodiester phosphodiesterase [Amylolactobacillus]|nr:MULTISPECIES: glycerophosphodiester phosphodiesterase [Amylolactobacillus]APT18050.1 hypothetical protein LA20533_01570 [Amylolactobacillus amylophilus DSM 20533 = JCM 1125]GED80594.1 glycerophosphoryl diester phosphodiesterase [Amylolactobacillus amylophilus]